MPLSLLDLPEDVIFKIFGDCDVKSAIALSKTCHYLRCLSNTHAVWLDIVKNIGPVPTPDTSSRTSSRRPLSTEALRSLAVRTARVEHNWNAPSGPAHTRQISIQRGVLPDETPIRRVKLLPDGKHILILRTQNIECWHIPSNECIWRKAEESAVIYDFGAEQAGSGYEVNIALAGRTFAPLNVNFIEIVQLDLNARTSSFAALRVLPDTQHMNALFHLTLHGFITAGSMLDVPEGTGKIVLFNWKMGMCMFLSGDLFSLYFGGIGLTTNYVLYTSQDDDTISLNAIRLDDLLHNWSTSPSHSTWHNVQLRMLQPLSFALARLTEKNVFDCINWQTVLTTYDSIGTRFNTECVAIVLNVGPDDMSALSTTFHCFTLPLVRPYGKPANGQLCLRAYCRTSSPRSPHLSHLDGALLCSRPSAAGHAIFRTKGPKINHITFSASPEKDGTATYLPVQIDTYTDAICLAPDSSSLAFVTDSAVVVRYYD